MGRDEGRVRVDGECADGVELGDPAVELGVLVVARGPQPLAVEGVVLPGEVLLLALVDDWDPVEQEGECQCVLCECYVTYQGCEALLCETASEWTSVILTGIELFSREIVD